MRLVQPDICVRRSVLTTAPVASAISQSHTPPDVNSTSTVSTFGKTLLPAIHNSSVNEPAPK